jgi:putative 2OG-Fe(II) oxygenase
MTTPTTKINADGFTLVPQVVDAGTTGDLLAAGLAILDRPDLRFVDYPAHRNGSVWKCGTVSSPGVRIAVDVLGVDPRIDRAVEAVLSHPAMTELLTEMLGRGMRLTQVTIREAQAGDQPLSYHQDSDGEVGIGVLLLDCANEEGTTSFIKGSHRIPATIRELLVMPRLDTRLVPSGLVSPGAGRAGDAIVFYNRTWHARHALRRNPRQVALMMSLFPSGKPYHFHEIDRETWSRLGPTVQRLTGVDEHLVSVGAGRVIYKGEEPTDAETRQILTLDAFRLNQAWRVILSPLVMINRAIDFVVRRATGRAVQA